MSYAYLSNPLMLDAMRASLESERRAAGGTATGALLPDEVRAFLGRLRLLEGVPFSHLVPDVELLPLESIRFFYVDREWTDALVEGALSVGTMTTLDREHLAALYGPIRNEVDAEERRLRSLEDARPGFAPANTITGFLLRSSAVSGWPGLHVRAYRQEVGDRDVLPEDDSRRLRLLRLERLAPAVLLAMFDGVPQVVHVEEPRQGIQFGVDVTTADGSLRGASIKLRDANTGSEVGTKTVPFRRGSPGVIDFKVLAERVAAEPSTHVTTHGSPEVSSSELALQLLQFPYRQVFGRTQLVVTFDDMFKPTVSFEELRAREERP
jgi:hypothetical protein